MKVGESIEIDSMEQATMVSSWTEYLYMNRISTTEYELVIKGHPPICEAAEYMDDNGEYDLPDEIDGEEVWGVEDEWVLSAGLVESELYETVRFQTAEDPQLLRWFDEYGWDIKAVKAGLPKS